MNKWRQDAPESTLFGMSPGIPLQSTTLDVLRTFHKNVGLVEQGQLVSPSILTREGLMMARATSGLLLTYTHAENLSHATLSDEWVKSVSAAMMRGSLFFGS
jgi:hypothetical protein